MKRNKMFSLVLGLFVMASLMIMPAIANALDVANASIERVGYNPAFQGAMVQLDDVSDGNFTGVRQYYLSETLGNQGLATLLTAYSLGKTVWVRIAGDGAPGSLVQIIYIND